MAPWGWGAARGFVGGACLVVGVALHTLSVFTRHWVATPLYTLSLFYNCTRASGACAKPFEEEPGIADGVQITVVTFTVALWAFLGRALPLGSREVTEVTGRRLKHAAIALVICATYLIVHVTTVFGRHAKGGNYAWSFHTEVTALVFALLATALTLLGGAPPSPGRQSNHGSSSPCPPAVSSAPPARDVCRRRSPQGTPVAPLEAIPSGPRVRGEGVEGVGRGRGHTRRSLRALTSLLTRVLPCASLDSSDSGGRGVEEEGGEGRGATVCRQTLGGISGVGRLTPRAPSLFSGSSMGFPEARFASEDETGLSPMTNSPRSPAQLGLYDGEFAHIPDTIIQTYKDSCTPKAYRVNRDRLGSRRKFPRLRSEAGTSKASGRTPPPSEDVGRVGKEGAMTPPPSTSKIKHLWQQRHTHDGVDKREAGDRILGRREEKRQREEEEEEEEDTKGIEKSWAGLGHGTAAFLSQTGQGPEISHTYVNVPRRQGARGLEGKRSRSFSQREKASLGWATRSPGDSQVTDGSLDPSHASVNSGISGPASSQKDRPTIPVPKFGENGSRVRKAHTPGANSDTPRKSRASSVTGDIYQTPQRENTGTKELVKPKNASEDSPRDRSRAKINKTSTFTMSVVPRRPKKKPRKKSLGKALEKENVESTAGIAEGDATFHEGKVTEGTGMEASSTRNHEDGILFAPREEDEVHGATTEANRSADQGIEINSAELFPMAGEDGGNQSAEFSIEDLPDYSTSDRSDTNRTGNDVASKQTSSSSINDISSRQDFLQGQSSSNLTVRPTPQCLPEGISQGGAATSAAERQISQGHGQDETATSAPLRPISHATRSESPSWKNLPRQSPCQSRVSAEDVRDGHPARGRPGSRETAGRRERETGDGQSDQRDGSSPCLATPTPLGAPLLYPDLTPPEEDPDPPHDGGNEQLPAEPIRHPKSLRRSSPDPFAEESFYSLGHSVMASKSLESIKSMYKTPREGSKRKTPRAKVSLESSHSGKSTPAGTVASSIPLPVRGAKASRDQAAANGSLVSASSTGSSGATSRGQFLSRPKGFNTKRPAPPPPSNKTRKCVSKLEFSKSDSSIVSPSCSFTSNGTMGANTHIKGGNSTFGKESPSAVVSHGQRWPVLGPATDTAARKLPSLRLQQRKSPSQARKGEKLSPLLNVSSQSLNKGQSLRPHDKMALSRSMDSVTGGGEGKWPGFYRDRFLSLLEPQTRHVERKMFRTTEL